MAEKSKIAWTDATLNFWSGCTKVSPGCTNCYAEGLSNRRMTTKAGAGIIGEWGPSGIRRKSKSAVNDALRLNAKPWVCEDCGGSQSQDPSLTNGLCWQTVCDGKLHRRRIFSLSLGDWLEGPPVKVVDGVPYGGIPVEWRAEMLDTIRRCDQVEWILCTKRPELWAQRLKAAYDWLAGTELNVWISDWLDEAYPKNITVLTSVEDQATADARIPALPRIPAARRGLSLEPLIGPVDLSRYLRRREVPICTGPRNNVVTGFTAPELDWLIIGGESGPKARPCNVEWIRSLVRQGQAAGVPVFVKQIHGNDGKLIKEVDCFPKDLQIKQFPFNE